MPYRALNHTDNCECRSLSSSKLLKIFYLITFNTKMTEDIKFIFHITTRICYHINFAKRNAILNKVVQSIKQSCISGLKSIHSNALSKGLRMKSGG